MVALWNLQELEALNRAWMEWAGTFTRRRPIILDRPESPAYGEQEGSAYNGHFGKTCYRALLCFNHCCGLEVVMLLEGNVASNHEWRTVLEPAVESHRRQDVSVHLRADTAFAIPEVNEYLEDNGVLYAIRIKPKAVQERCIEHPLRRRVGLPSKKPKVSYESFSYQARRWDGPRWRVVAKVEWHGGELFPRVGLTVTNLNLQSRNVLCFYNGRGTAEQWIKESKYALKWTRVSCRRFLDNAIRLQFFAPAYNLANFLRRLVLPRRLQHWSLRTLREKLIKAKTRTVRHARYVTFQMAEVEVPMALSSRFLHALSASRRCATPSSAQRA